MKFHNEPSSLYHISAHLILPFATAFDFFSLVFLITLLMWSGGVQGYFLMTFGSNVSFSVLSEQKQEFGLLVPQSCLLFYLSVDLFNFDFFDSKGWRMIWGNVAWDGVR